MGDDISSKALEQFLMATKGNLEAAVDILYNMSIHIHSSSSFTLTLVRDVLE